jgi:branched-chain amino acid aminotransferase
MSSTRIWLSSLGVPVEPADAKISVFDRGFLYGDSVYETLRTSGGKFVRWHAHLDRLRRSAQGIGLEIAYGDADIRSAVRQTVEASGNSESRIRIVVTRGTGPLMLDVRGAEDQQLVVFVQPLTPISDAVYERGVSAVIVGDGPGLTQPGLKTGNYLPNILALKQAIEQRGDDAIVCNRAGEVAEGATSNVFMVSAGELSTPPLEDGLLAGITRSRVIELCAEVGLTLHERSISPAGLRSADEVFLTSSIRGIMPVTRLDGQPMSGERPGELTRRLMGAYEVWLSAIARGESAEG